MVFIVLLAVRKKPPGAAAKGVLAGHGWRWVKFLPPSKQAWPLFLIYGFFKSTLMLQKSTRSAPRQQTRGAAGGFLAALERAGANDHRTHHTPKKHAVPAVERHLKKKTLLTLPAVAARVGLGLQVAQGLGGGCKLGVLL